MMRKIAVAAGAALVFAACPASPQGTSERPPMPARPSAPRCSDLDVLAERVRRGHVEGGSPDINLIPREPNYIGSPVAPVHSGPWDYLAEVPLLIYGPGFVNARTFARTVTMADVAPTTAALIGSERFEAIDGRVLPQALEKGGSRPRLVLTIVWDGGGWNVLAEHPHSHPYFVRLGGRSALYDGFEIGSSPSVTPPIHATLSTGAFPRSHGIPGLRIREDGDYVDPFLGLDPSRMRVRTLADVYDMETGNRAVTGMLATVNWHLSMIGQGAGIPGADRDPVVLFDDAGETFTNEALYSLPAVGEPEALVRAAARLDGLDGSEDGDWRGHPLDDPQVRYASPAHVQYQQMLLERLIVTEGFGRDGVPDLLYVNFKSLDDAGHAWGMTSPEAGDTLRAQDDALRRLVRFLDREVGRERWVLFLTADHGQTPYPRESGAWAIGGGELARDANGALDADGDDVALVDRVSSPGAYLNRGELADNELQVQDVARWMAGYTVAQNLKDDAELEARFEGREDEQLFDAVLVGDGRALSEVCS